MLHFNILNKSEDTRARRGVIQTSHGQIDTPVFMPVGTLGTVKSLTPEELAEAGVQILLGNTYHLFLRPGIEVISQFSGLHRFMNWNGTILTDSGGFQVFSLAKLSKINDEGVIFQSHIDGSRHELTPEKAVSLQMAFGPVYSISGGAVGCGSGPRSDHPLGRTMQGTMETKQFIFHSPVRNCPGGNV